MTTSELEIRSAFLARLLATTEGRQHMLSVSVAAEEGDEGAVFDRIAAVVDDPKLRRMVEQHQADEVRHVWLFRECIDRLALEYEPVPDELRIIRRIVEMTGTQRVDIDGPEAVVRVYALLLAIEERGVEQFPLIADAFQRHDAETAEVYRRVARDERGHARYCRRIGRHFAPDDATWDQVVAAASALEAAAFAEVSAASFASAVERGLVSPDDLVVDTSPAGVPGRTRCGAPPV